MAAALASPANPASTDRVVDAITAGIIAGRFVPGQRLIEAQLTRSLRVSRGPVREAVRRLDALGVLAKTMHRGACVRALSRSEALDLMAAVEPLTGLIARLAASALGARSLHPADARLLAELRVYQEDGLAPHSRPAERHRFYDLLMVIGRNSQLPSLMPTLRLQLLRMQVGSYMAAKDQRAYWADIGRVAAAILAADEQAAERAMLAHVRLGARIIARLPDEAFMPPAEP